MAYCPVALLGDISDVISAVRTWDGVVEKKPGVLYVGADPFLHFHLIGGRRRRADIKGCGEWTQLDLPQPITTARRRVLLGELRKRHREKLNARAKGTRRQRARPCA